MNNFDVIIADFGLATRIK